MLINILVKTVPKPQVLPNIEVELDRENLGDIAKNKPEDIKRYSYYLSDFKDKFLLEFYPDIREWKHSKFVTGKAIVLLKQITI